MLGLKLSMLIKRGPWRCQVIAWTNVDSSLLESISVQFHGECAKYAGKSFHLKFKFSIFDESAMGKWINRLISMPCISLRYQWVKPQSLTHWGRATHICVSKLTIIASDNGLSPGRCQAIIWNNDGILSIGLLGTNFSEILIGIHKFSFKKMRLKVSSAKWRPCCLGLNVFKFCAAPCMTEPW